MIGKIISHYKIIEKLGAGGMGVVYKAEDTKLKRTVALKFLPPSFSLNDDAKQRFIHEAQAASALDHPNICTIFEIRETEDKQLFIAMAYYEGETLKEKIEKEPLKIGDALDIACQIAEGLSKAHEKGIVHRDIKPANILVADDGTVKILDFGLAKSASRNTVTKLGSTVGTVAYMSPEQTKGEDVDHRTDIWSFGVVLYEMITGHMPFKGEYDQAIIYSILNEEPERIENDLPAELESVIQKALHKDPNKRYKNINELLIDLKSVKKNLEVEQVDYTEKPVPSIAVLPFVNMSADPEQEYFCDGMAEELISTLTKIENLQVPARTSAFAFKGEKIDVREIGRKLNVATVLEGSVRKAGNRLRITAQLINVADGYHLWSERFDRELDDVFAIQDEISMAIVDKLKVQLLKGEKQKLVKRYTDNLEAYSLYLKGRYYWNSLTPEGWEKSYECYQQAIAIDPNYALAFVGLAIWHTSLAVWGDVHPREAISKGRELTLKAIELDDTISDAHNWLGMLHEIHDWNRPEGYREYQRSLELEPGNAFTHISFALSLAAEKNFDKALHHAKKAQQLDPLSSNVNTWAASIFTSSGQYEASVLQFQQIITTDPYSWQPHLFLSMAYIHQEKFQDAILAAAAAVKRSGGASMAKTYLGCAYALAGQKDKAEEQLNSLLERCQQKYVSSTFFVWLYITLQESDEAYIWLQKAVRDHDLWLCWYGISPVSMRAREARFDHLIKTNGLVV